MPCEGRNCVCTTRIRKVHQQAGAGHPLSLPPNHAEAFRHTGGLKSARNEAIRRTINRSRDARYRNAALAQLVEHIIRNDGVACSKSRKRHQKFSVRPETRQQFTIAKRISLRILRRETDFRLPARSSAPCRIYREIKLQPVTAKCLCQTASIRTSAGEWRRPEIVICFPCVADGAGWRQTCRPIVARWTLQSAA